MDVHPPAHRLILILPSPTRIGERPTIEGELIRGGVSATAARPNRPALTGDGTGRIEVPVREVGREQIVLGRVAVEDRAARIDRVRDLLSHTRAGEIELHSGNKHEKDLHNALKMLSGQGDTSLGHRSAPRCGRAVRKVRIGTRLLLLVGAAPAGGTAIDEQVVGGAVRIATRLDDAAEESALAIENVTEVDRGQHAVFH